jgi:hypothetical protein
MTQEEIEDELFKQKLEIGKLKKIIISLRNAEKLTKNNYTMKTKCVLKVLYISFYLILLGLSFYIVWYLINYQCKSCVSIKVEYNVGEIIAGILGGSGIGLAGLAYAFKTFFNGPSDSPESSPNNPTNPQNTTTEKTLSDYEDLA